MREKGFTLIELMVIVLIIAVAVAIAVPTYLGAKHRADCREGRLPKAECVVGEPSGVTTYCDGEDKVYVLSDNGERDLQVVKGGCPGGIDR